MKTLYSVLAKLPALLILIFFSVFITAATSNVVFLQLITAGYDKIFSLAVGILTATVVYGFIRFNHKLSAFIKKDNVNDK